MAFCYHFRQVMSRLMLLSIRFLRVSSVMLYLLHQETHGYRLYRKAQISVSYVIFIPKQLSTIIPS